MIARHIGNVGTEIGLDHWPNIYCGAAVLMFFLLYLGSRKITFREKAVYCTMLILFYASFSVNVLNFIWHGFHYPNSLPCRQSFIYIALMLFMCYHAYIHLEDTSWKSVCLAFWGAVSFVLLAEKLVNNPEQYHFSVFYVALLFIAVYGGLIYLYHKGKWSLDAILLTALAVIAIEAAVNTAVTSIPTTSRTAYVKDNQDVEELVWNIKSDTFYRVEKTDRKTKNDGAWMNFPSVSLFSSTANASLSDFFRKWGVRAPPMPTALQEAPLWWTACCPCGTAYMGTSSLPMDSEICPQEKGACGCTRINLPCPWHSCCHRMWRVTG